MGNKTKDIKTCLNCIHGKETCRALYAYCSFNQTAEERKITLPFWSKEIIPHIPINSASKCKAFEERK